MQHTSTSEVWVAAERESESGLAGQATLQDLISLMVTLIYTQEYPMGPLVTGQWGYVTVLSRSQPGYGIEIDSRNSRGSKRPVTSSSSLGKTVEWHWGWGEAGFFFLRCYRICWQIGYEIREKDTVKDDCCRDVAKRLVKRSCWWWRYREVGVFGRKIRSPALDMHFEVLVRYLSSTRFSCWKEGACGLKRHLWGYDAA